MNNSQVVLDVALIVRDFLQHEARTLEISKGKMLDDQDMGDPLKTYLKVG